MSPRLLLPTTWHGACSCSAYIAGDVKCDQPGTAKDDENSGQLCHRYSNPTFRRLNQPGPDQGFRYGCRDSEEIAVAACCRDRHGSRDCCGARGECCRGRSERCQGRSCCRKSVHNSCRHIRAGKVATAGIDDRPAGRVLDEIERSKRHRCDRHVSPPASYPLKMPVCGLERNRGRRPGPIGSYVKPGTSTYQLYRICFSYTYQYGYMSRLHNGVAYPMLADPQWLTALASLVTSLATLAWALRRRR